MGCRTPIGCALGQLHGGIERGIGGSSRPGRHGRGVDVRGSLTGFRRPTQTLGRSVTPIQLRPRSPANNLDHIFVPVLLRTYPSN